MYAYGRTRHAPQGDVEDTGFSGQAASLADARAACQAGTAWELEWVAEHGQRWVAWDADENVSYHVLCPPVLLPG